MLHCSGKVRARIHPDHFELASGDVDPSTPGPVIGAAQKSRISSGQSATMMGLGSRRRKTAISGPGVVRLDWQWVRAGTVMIGITLSRTHSVGSGGPSRGELNPSLRRQREADGGRQSHRTQCVEEVSHG